MSRNKMILAVVVVIAVLVGAILFMSFRNAQGDADFNNELVAYQKQVIDASDSVIAAIGDNTQDYDDAVGNIKIAHEEAKIDIREAVDGTQELNGSGNREDFYNSAVVLFTFSDDFMNDEMQEFVDLLDGSTEDDLENNQVFANAVSEFITVTLEEYSEEFGNLNNAFLDEQQKFAESTNIVLEE